MNRWTVRTLVCVAVFACGSLPLAVEVSAQDRVDPDQAIRIAQRVTRVLPQAHITRHRVDDAISERVHKGFLESFDPLKLYFMQSDIDEFDLRRDNHDNEILRGDVGFAYDVQQRFLDRLDQRVKLVEDLLDGDFDFDREETIITDPDAADYPKTEAEVADRWRKRIKYELVTRMIDNAEQTEEQAKERIRKRYRNLQRRWLEIDREDVAEMYLSSLTTSYDPHSTYMSPRTWEDFQIQLRNSLEGIGAMLQSEDGVTTLKSIVPGGAADKDGRIQPGDDIVGVGQGEDGELVDVVDMKLRDVVDLIRGEAGTVVKLEVAKGGEGGKLETYDVVRQKITLEDRKATSEVLNVPEAMEDGLPAQGGEASGKVVTTPGKADYKVGVINLPSFYADDEALQRGDPDASTASADVARILADFRKQGVQAVVMDLRVNGGGLLSEAVDLTGLFIDRGPVVQVRNYDNRVEVLDDENRGMAWEGPLVVLVSRFSASASEIFAGAIKDYGRGVVVGDSATHGKGSVQRILPLSNPNLGGDEYGVVKLTMQKFYRVNGFSTQNRGVPSDVVLPSPTDHDDFGEANLDYALQFDRIADAGATDYGFSPEDVVEAVKQDSADRFARNPELEKLTAKKQKADERRAQTTKTFTAASIRKEREELTDEEKEALADPDDAVLDEEKDKKPFGSDAYTKEVLRITADYLRALDRRSQALGKR